MPDTALRKYSILVVDDDRSVQRVLDAALRRQGFAVWLAANGREALERYQHNGSAIDVVLLDMHMPVLDGPQTLAALQELNPQVRCCFMSGDVGRYAEWKLGCLGAVAVLRKPFHVAEVAQMLWHLAGTDAGKPFMW